jgi:hypothetical protein
MKGKPMNDKLAWYREPWPWLLMAGPGTVMIAGAITTVLALRTSDGLVADDYYRQGLAINRVIARDAAARALAIHGSLEFQDGQVHASLAANARLPDRIRLTLVHATRAGDDRVVHLSREVDGGYSAPLPGAVANGRWTLVMETPDWRLEVPADLRKGARVEIPSRAN